MTSATAAPSSAMPSAATATTPPTAPPETTSLSGRLPEPDDEQLQAARALYAKGDKLELDDGGRHLLLQTNPVTHGDTVDAVQLAHAGGDVLFVQCSGHNEPLIGDLAWQDLRGEARLLTWALSHEDLLAGLSEAMGQHLLPTAFVRREPVPGQRLWLGVLYEKKDNDVRWEGLLGLDAAGSRAFAAVDAWHFDEQAAAERRQRITLGCELHAPSPQVDFAALRSVTPGDVLMLGTRANVLASLRLMVPAAPSQHIKSVMWGANWASDALTLTQRFAMDAGMQEAPPDETPAAAPEDDDTREASPFAGLPVRLDVIVATPQLTVGEVEQLAPGHVLALQQPLDHAVVRLRANGAAFAKGELVALGDSLGVRIVSIEDTG